MEASPAGDFVKQRIILIFEDETRSYRIFSITHSHVLTEHFKLRGDKISPSLFNSAGLSVR